MLTGIVAMADPEAAYKTEISPLLEKYCFDCHAEGTSKGKFSMDEFKDLSAHLKDQKHWLTIWRNVRSQIMPPSDKDQPATLEKQQLLAWIEKDVFKLDPNNPDPGRVTIRRLNRTEYQNAVYDLLGVEYDTREVFPADDTGYGFDNIGAVLSMSPMIFIPDAITDNPASGGVASLRIGTFSVVGFVKIDIADTYGGCRLSVRSYVGWKASGHRARRYRWSVAASSERGSDLASR